MELILQQMPIVVHSLNIGFLQTLRLFFVTLIGAFPLGLIIAFGSMSQFQAAELFYQSDRLDRAWYAADDPASDHLLFPRAGSWKVRSGAAERPDVLWRLPYPLSLTMPAIFLRSTVAGSRVCRWDRKKQDWCLA